MHYLRIWVFLCISLASPISAALPTLGDITGDSALNQYTDTGARAVRLDSVTEATLLLLFEFAGFRDTTSFGIYGFQYSDGDGHAILGDRLELFSGSDGPVTSTTIRLDQATSLITNVETGESAQVAGGTFGFYIENTAETGGFTWFSHTSLNCKYIGTEDRPDCLTPTAYLDPISDYLFEDHALIFDTSDNTHGSLLGSDIVVAFEDLCFLDCGSDRDFNDFVVGMSSVVLPEPGPLPLLASGLTVIVLLRLRRCRSGPETGGGIAAPTA